ncbi:WXG100 family type VII secretion target [Sediminihabitans luteus]|uniref:ESAT-6-like protein n=1 Tax=Sediminihabitans luteus TaxID=1138585 RepID=A0A2M9CE84_9CELL|nr:WXG100 family type VII secretion target [Sediminihabitans luteus]PJJ70188.1 WXG100 family type VII secretion target [Sediminihabitans luteus]GII97659.1 ESAT-6-like protein [Sediminihabitans luteus]
MTSYEVDSARVAQASGAVSGSVTAMRGEVQAMMRHLHDLQSVWRGSAATAFGGLMAQWQATQVQVESVLDDITAALGSAARTYEDAEAQAARLFSA